MNTPDTEWGEVQVGYRVICDGLSTGKTGKVLGVGSSEHSIKLLIDGVERYEPDYCLLEVTVENKIAIELLLSHYSALSSRDTHWKERVGELIEKTIQEERFSGAPYALNKLKEAITNEDNLK